MADIENEPLEPTDPPDDNGGTSPESNDAQATDPPDNNGGGAAPITN